MKSFLSNLRTRIILIVLVALLPAWAMMLFSISRQRATIEADVMKESLRTAELAAGREEQVIEEARRLLTTLHLFFQTMPEPRTQCLRFFEHLVREFPRYACLGAVNRQGDVFCGAGQDRDIPNVADSPWFQRALHSGQFALGDYLVGEFSGKSALVVTSPLTGLDGRVETVLFAAIEVDWVDKLYVPPQVRSIEGAFLALVDRHGVILSDWRDPRREMASIHDGTLMETIRQGESKVLMGKDSRGTEVLYAVSPIKSQSPSRSVSIVTGIPAKMAFAEANRARNLNLALLGGVSVLMIAVFWMGANSVILRRLDPLFAAAQGLTVGDLCARSGLAQQDDELGRFAKVFDEMGQALERREREHQEAEARIRASEERLRRLQTHVQQVREEERLRLARVIHDDLGQALTALRIDLSWVRRKTLSDNPRAWKDKLDGMTRIIDDAMNTVHHVSSELRPRILDDLGLVEAFEWQAEEFQRRTGIPCEVIVGDFDLDLPTEQSTGLFRVLQEALTNVARHSGATAVGVSLDAGPRVLTITISDNGRGIRAEEIESPLSYGLLGIRERVHAMAGHIEISGDAGAGTRLTISIPLTSADAE